MTHAEECWRHLEALVDELDEEKLLSTKLIEMLREAKVFVHVERLRRWEEDEGAVATVDPEKFWAESEKRMAAALNKAGAAQALAEWDLERLRRLEDK